MGNMRKKAIYIVSNNVPTKYFKGKEDNCIEESDSHNLNQVTSMFMAAIMRQTHFK